MMTASVVIVVSVDIFASLGEEGFVPVSVLLTWVDPGRFKPQGGMQWRK
jgi:hypothetical protein